MKIISLKIEIMTEKIMVVPHDLPIANLPNLVRKGVEVFDNVEQQELIIYGIVTVVSSLVNRVSGTYGQEDRYANLFMMAVGHAGTGKGILVHTRQLLAGINNLFLEESQQDLKKFQSLNKDKRGIAPPFRTVLIPGNTTQAKLLKHLSDNNPDVPSIIFETEMDTISNAIRSEHGNFSAIIRNGFQNEPISKSIVQNSEFINIECPKPAIVLSGTPGQLTSFINNREDGLLSRFLVVDFKGSNDWRNVAPSPDSMNLTEYFKKLSEEYLPFYEFISQRDLKVCLTENQWKSIEAYGTTRLKEVINIFGREANGIVFRNGLILFKICMVLTALRKFEDRNMDDEILCTDVDFQTALYLMDRSIFCVLDLWESLPKAKQVINTKRSEYLTKLSDKVTRAEAVAVAETLQIKERTADRYLHEGVQMKDLIRKGKGVYFKPCLN